MTGDEAAFLTIAELGRAYRAGTVTPVDAIEACLDRIARLDGRLNAFITVTADLARAQARQAADELAAGRDRGPLHGVPVAIKDIVDVAGVETSWATRARPPLVAERDAALVANLRAAGAVFPGKTNCLEYAYGAVHPEVGQTNNPWDPARSSGGSSGGSAVAVAAGMAHGAVGTDTGGSIRIPAAYCGIAGLKPAFGTVPTDGVHPLSWSLDHAGPMARTPACAAALLDAMTGRPAVVPQARLAGARFGVVALHRDDAAVRPGVRAAFDAACAALEAAGAVVEDVAVPALAEADQALIDVILPEASHIHAALLAGNPAGYAAVTREQLEQGFAVRAVDYVDALRCCARLRRELGDALAGREALLTPGAPWTAAAEDPSVIDGEGAAEMRFHAPWNLAGLPALVLPCGTDGGLPVALQLGGAAGSEHRLLALGTALADILPAVGRPPD